MKLIGIFFFSIERPQCHQSIESVIKTGFALCHAHIQLNNNNNKINPPPPDDGAAPSPFHLSVSSEEETGETES